jgi:hypothetical protein
VPHLAGHAPEICGITPAQARALLENLTSSRGDSAERRTLGAEGVEDWLARFVRRDISGATNKIRDAARTVAVPLGLESEFKQLDKIIGALPGTRRAHLTAPAAIARAAGKPYRRHYRRSGRLPARPEQQRGHRLNCARIQRTDA